ERLRGGSVTKAGGEALVGEPLYSEDEVAATQAAMVRRCAPERWRVLLLLSPPRSVGQDRILEWRARFAPPALVLDEPQHYSCAALYFPWVWGKAEAAAPLRAMPPTPYVAGVIARRDLARGPHLSPANE